MSRIIKASDPGSAWFGGGSRSPSAAGSTRNVRLVATGVTALVSVLGFALFLHLYICHVRRRNRRRAARAAVLQTEAAEAAAKAPKGGLEPSAIAALPTEAYRETGEAGCGECAICLGAVQEGDAVRVLPACSHVFHVACVDTWLGSSSSCPVCRAGVEPPPLPPPAAAAWVQEKQQGLEKEDAGSSAPPCGLGASLMRMLSRERPSARRPQQGDHAVEMEDLESQQPQQQHAVNN